MALPRWLHNMLMGAAYMVGHRNPLVDEILSRSDEEAAKLDWDAVLDHPDYNWKPVTLNVKFVGRLPPSSNYDDEC